MRQVARQLLFTEDYTVSKEMIEKANDRLRKMMDNCDNVQCSDDLDECVLDHTNDPGSTNGAGRRFVLRPVRALELVSLHFGEMWRAARGRHSTSTWTARWCG